MIDSEKNSELRGRSAYKITDDFEWSRRVGGGKSADLPGEPRTETDRALLESRAALERLRRLMTVR
ncbi:MAG: hypothetical protein H7Y38_01290 [Armatimonadetes bacterium]|nr:hypothetical protein [Armatimonadota bacterium]